MTPEREAEIRNTQRGYPTPEVGSLLAELDRLRAENKQLQAEVDQQKAIRRADKESEYAEEEAVFAEAGLPYPVHSRSCLRMLADVLVQYRDEVDRLRRGDFTEAEFQNLCHNMTVDGQPVTAETVQRFKRGCEEYHRKLFGGKASSG